MPELLLFRCRKNVPASSFSVSGRPARIRRDRIAAPADSRDGNRPSANAPPARSRRPGVSATDSISDKPLCKNRAQSFAEKRNSPEFRSNTQSRCERRGQSRGKSEFCEGSGDEKINGIWRSPGKRAMRNRLRQRNVGSKRPSRPDGSGSHRPGQTATRRPKKSGRNAGSPAVSGPAEYASVSVDLNRLPDFGRDFDAKTGETDSCRPNPTALFPNNPSEPDGSPVPDPSGDRGTVRSGKERTMTLRGTLFAIAAALLLLPAGCSGPETTPAKPGPAKNAAPAAPRIRTAPAPQPATGTGDCYQAGFRYGVCAAKSTSGGSCDPATQAPIPPECRPRPETQQGIKDGLRSVQMRLRPPGS